MVMFLVPAGHGPGTTLGAVKTTVRNPGDMHGASVADIMPLEMDNRPLDGRSAGDDNGYDAE